MMYAHGISSDHVVRKVDNVIHNPVNGESCFVHTLLYSLDGGLARWIAFE